MTVRFYFENIKDSDKLFLESYFIEKKIIRLQNLLRHGNLKLAKFTANAKYHSRRSVFIVRLGLAIAQNDLSAEEKGRTPLEALDLAFDRIIGQLRKVESKKHK